ncbi:hypothetical protein VKS41_002265 [Umbelopsis sp. WA50703]
MTTDLRSLEAVLSKHGYVHSWKLLKQRSSVPTLDGLQANDSNEALQALLEHPVCQTVDIVVDGCRRYRTPAQYQLYQQFLSILGSRSNRNEISMDAPPTSPSPSYFSSQFDQQPQQYDPELRQNGIEEFIATEETYVKTLITLVDVFERPLRSYSQDRMNCILKPFNCTKIFLNIDQILSVNQAFVKDLRNYQKNPNATSFGDICEAHVSEETMANFDCYTRYLHEHQAAQSLHTKEYKVNQSYRSFLIKAKDHPDAKRKQLQDLLVEPVQRISRYTMLLKDIIKSTPPEHPDHAALISALSKAEEIATMADDNRTRLARMFLNLYNSIKGSPCSLVNQSRRLVHHVDATEIDLVSKKPLRPVTILIFTDKVLVASRPAYSVSGSDLCGIDTEVTSPGPASSFLARKAEKSLKRDRSLKFKGWSDIDQVEVFNGPTTHSSSFLLRVNPPNASTSLTTASSFEEYFSEQPIRLYSIAPHSEEVEVEQTTQAYVSQRDSFYSSFHYSKALFQGSAAETTYHHTRSNVSAYSNIYNFNSYPSIKRKSNVAIVYVEEGECAIDRCLNQDNTVPWLVGLVYADIRGFRFSIRSKLHLGTIRERTNSMPLLTTGFSRAEEGTIDFESVFWNNVQASEIKLRHSNVHQEKYSTINSVMARKQQEGRPRSLSKPRSIPTIGKLFGSNSSSTANLQVNAIAANTAAAPVRSTSSSTVSSINSSVPSVNSRRPRINSISGPLMDSSQPPSYSQSVARSTSSSNSVRSYTSTESDLWSSGTSISSSTSTEYLDYLTSKPQVRSSRPVRTALPTVPQGYVVSDIRASDGTNGVSDHHADDSQRGRRRSRSGQLNQLQAPEPGSPTVEQKKFDLGLEDMQKYLSSVRISLSKGQTTTSDMKWSEPEWSPGPDNRNSVASSVATNNSTGFSKRASRSSIVSSDNSTRSSLSLEDLDFRKESPKSDLDTPTLLSDNSRRSSIIKTSPTIMSPRSPDSINSDNMNMVSKSVSKMQNEYVGKWQEMFEKCSGMAQEIELLTETLRERNNDVANLRKLYRDTADENKILYEKFNEELEDIANVLEDQRYKSDVFGVSRPAHPTPEGQLRRKLKAALKERNYWQQKSGELQREIESLRKGVVSA